MKSQSLKFALPIGMGLALLTITIFGIVSTTIVGCEKTTGTSTSTSTRSAYCNPGNTYNYSSQKCCPNSTPYYYPGTHGIKAPGCYASCPYIGDCGTKYTKY